jgi:membrane protease YdiL (CAAX protease family)
MTSEGQRADDSFATDLRGFGLPGLLAIVVILLPGNAVGMGGLMLPVSALLVLAWAALSRTAWRDLGLARPRSWPLAIGGGIVIGVALKLVMKALVMPLLGAPPVNAAYHVLAHNTAALPAAVFAMVVGAGFGEELTFRGYGFERLGRLVGSGPPAKAAILVATSVLFGVVHLQTQGIAGAEQALINGLVFGGLYLATGTLWTAMAAHAAFDLAALAMIYFDVETAVARSLLG